MVAAWKDLLSLSQSPFIYIWWMWGYQWTSEELQCNNLWWTRTSEGYAVWSREWQKQALFVESLCSSPLVICCTHGSWYVDHAWKREGGLVPKEDQGHRESSVYICSGAEANVVLSLSLSLSLSRISLKPTTYGFSWQTVFKWYCKNHCYCIGILASLRCVSIGVM